MKIEHGKIEGDIEIDSDLKMHGMFTGNVTVKRGGHLILHGLAAQDLITEPDSKVEIKGMVKGNVINKGGQFSVSGMVSGRLLEQEQ